MNGTLWITGLCGFTGRHLAEWMHERADRPRVVGIDRQTLVPTAHVDAYHPTDVCEPEQVARVALAEPPTWVIHLAGLTHADSPAELWYANVGGLLGLGQGLRSAGCAPRVVSIGSAAEYLPGTSDVLTETDPTGPVTAYGRSKLAQTLLSLDFERAFGMSACVARTFNLVGPGLSSQFVVGRLVESFAQVAADGAITLQRLDSSRDFVDVRDAVDAYWRLALSGRSGEVYNVCSGRSTSIQSLVEILCRVTGTRPRMITHDAAHRRGEHRDATGSYEKLARATGWAPSIEIERSIENMLRDASSAMRSPLAATSRTKGC